MVKAFLSKIIKPHIFKNRAMNSTQLILSPREIFQDIIHKQVAKVNSSGFCSHLQLLTIS